MPKAAANGTKVEEPTVANASFKGWLSKMGHINTDFKRRYFMLCGERLGYFESLQTANKGKPKGTMQILWETGWWHSKYVVFLVVSLHLFCLDSTLLCVALL